MARLKAEAALPMDAYLPDHWKSPEGAKKSQAQRRDEGGRSRAEEQESGDRGNNNNRGRRVEDRRSWSSSSSAGYAVGSRVGASSSGKKETLLDPVRGKNLPPSENANVAPIGFDDSSWPKHMNRTLFSPANRPPKKAAEPPLHFYGSVDPQSSSMGGDSNRLLLVSPGKVARGINGRSVEPKTNAHLLQIPSLENSTSQSRNFNASSQEDSFLAMLGLGAAGGQAGGSPGRWNGSANFAGPLAGTQSSSSVQPRSDADRPTPPLRTPATVNPNSPLFYQNFESSDHSATDHSASVGRLTTKQEVGSAAAASAVVGRVSKKVQSTSSGGGFSPGSHRRRESARTASLHNAPTASSVNKTQPPLSKDDKRIPGRIARISNKNSGRGRGGSLLVGVLSKTDEQSKSAATSKRATSREARRSAKNSLGRSPERRFSPAKRTLSPFKQRADAAEADHLNVPAGVAARSVLTVPSSSSSASNLTSSSSSERQGRERRDEPPSINPTRVAALASALAASVSAAADVEALQGVVSSPGEVVRSLQHRDEGQEN